MFATLLLALYLISDCSGPAGEYMAKCPGSSCTKVDATTLDWFCIAQHNYNKDTGKWPTESMPSNREWTFKLPTGLPSGEHDTSE